MSVGKQRLGSYLSHAFQSLELVEESFGKAVWKALQEDKPVLVRSFANWSLKDQELEVLSQRFQRLTENPRTALPQPIALERCEGHLVVLEEWVEGHSWQEAVLSRESALESGKELFDLLTELADLELLHGGISPSNLLIENGTGNLKILGLLSRPPLGSASFEKDLQKALSCLQGLVKPDEFSELGELSSPREVSKRLDLFLCQVEVVDARPDLVGRELALQELSRAYSEGGMVAVKAPGGGGKSRLIADWCEHLEDRILVGKAEADVAPRPFQLFQAPLEKIEAELKSNQNLYEQLRSELNISLPLMESWSSGSNQLQRGAIIWLGKLLSALNRYQPTILVLEDVHWADEFTLSFIEYWSEEPQETFLIVSYRPEELNDSHSLRSLGCRAIELRPLTKGQAERIIRSLQPGASRTFIESATQNSQGNPFLLMQYLRSGNTSGGHKEIGLSGLSPECRHALAVGALLGGNFSLQLLEDCLESLPDFQEAETQGLITVNGGSVSFQHDRYREFCLVLLDDAQRSDYHLKAAKAQASHSNPYAAAYHYWQASRPDLGAEHALTAAQSSREQDDLNTAVYYFLIALKGLDSADGQRTLLLYQLGDCYRLIGRYSDSESRFLEVLSLTEDPILKARSLHALGDVHFKQDELQKAQSAILEGLRLLGSNRPRSLEFAFAYQAARLAFRSFFPQPNSNEQVERELLRASLYNRLAYVNWFLEGPIASIWAHFCELNIAERYGDSTELARAQANHAMAMSAIPWWSRSIAYGAQSLATAQRIDDKWSEGRVGHFYGAALLGVGKLAEAESVLVRAQELLEQTGDRWEENGVRYHLAIVYYRQGKMRGATELAYQTQQIGVDIGDRLAAGDNLYTMARTLAGKMPRTLLEREKQFESPDLQRTCELLCAEALVCIRERKYGEAVELIERSCARYQEKGVRNLYSASLPAWLCTARRLHLQSLPQGKRKAQLSLARSWVKRALKEAGKYRMNLPHALREQALLALLVGSPEQARTALTESLTIARKQGQMHEVETNEALMAHLGWLLGSPPPARKPTGTEHLWLLGLADQEDGTEPETLERLLQSATSISNCLSQETALFSLVNGSLQTLGQVDSCMVLCQSLTEQWELTCGDHTLPIDIEQLQGEGWHTEPIPDMDQELLLVLKLRVERLGSKTQSLLSFLIAVTTAVLDRAKRTATSTLLSRDLRRSSVRLHQEAERLSRAKEQLLLSERLAVTGRLATGLVHDLRNLNMSVTTMAECLLLDVNEDDGVADGLSEILQAGKKATDLLTHLSGLNRGDLIGARLIDLKQRIQEAKPLLLSLCGPRIQLGFQLKSDLWTKIDPIQMDRILLNLVVNARDAVSFGGRITVSLVSISITQTKQGHPCEVPPGDYCKVVVRDNGSGIPDDVLPKIFDLHFTTKGDAGTGVGLATVLEMIEVNKGYMTVSTGEQGTVFELYFPRENVPQPVGV